MGLDFGAQTIAGNYTIVATSGTTSCTTNMSGSAVITINPLPTTYVVTGGGNYCAGGGGINVGLPALLIPAFTTTPIDECIVAGRRANGSAPVRLSAFGPQTLGGAYTVVATNAGTSCMNNMTGSVNITVNAIPAAYTVTGGGNYCPGGGGVPVGISGSTAGISYQLLKNGAILGAPVTGTGSPLSFGMQTAPAAYSVMATNPATSCTSNMLDTVNVAINTLPATYTIYGPHTNYCAGGTGIDLTLSGSESGVSYQLFVGGVPTGAPIAGTGFAMDLGLQTTAGAYTVQATNSTTGCTRYMSGSFTIAIDPLPTSYSMVGGGDYCSGGTGVGVGLSNSAIGITYQLYNGIGTVGGPISGTGSPINFGQETAAGPYTVIATNTATTCANTMAGSALVIVDPLPTVFAVTGGGNYCAGGTGVHVGLSGSNNTISYQLYNTGALSGGPALGTGLSIDFGLETTTGNYTVVATNTSTGCKSTMAGSQNVGINSLPTPFIVSGGGSYCEGGSGVAVNLLSSTTGVNYQLLDGTMTMGAPLSGNGSELSFGLQTGAGTYTVVATNTSTTCTNTMSGSAVIVVNPLPTTHNVTGGGNYCVGSSGVPHRPGWPPVQTYSTS